MSETDKLLPCPHCGGNAELDTMRGYRAMNGTLGNAAAIYCTDCLAEISFCYEDANNVPRDEIIQMVVDQWNRRPAPALDHATLEAVAEIAKLACLKLAYQDLRTKNFRLKRDPYSPELYGDAAAAAIRALAKEPGR